MDNLLPAAWQPYAKAWLSLLGVIVAAIVTAWPEVPRWVTIVGAVLASVGVYLASNEAPQGGKHAAGTVHVIDEDRDEP